MELVIIESPWKAQNSSEQVRNSQYARMCLSDSIARGEAPFASHLIYTQVLNEEIPEERMAGIEIGLLWGKCATRTVVYQDFGISAGMTIGIERAITDGREIEYRNIPLNFDAARESLLTLAREVCEFFAVNYRTLSSSTRIDEVVIARHVYFKVARNLYPNISFKAIGNIVNRDHASVMHGIKNIEAKYHIQESYDNFCRAKNLDFKPLENQKICQ